MSEAGRILSATAAPEAQAGDRLALLCFGFEQASLHKQPWSMADGIASGLAAHGVAVTVLTDALEPPRDRPYAIRRLVADRAGLAGAAQAVRAAIRELKPDRLLAVGGLGELARLPRLALGVPVDYVLASPRLQPRELLAMPPGVWLDEWRLLWRPLVNALLPSAWLLRRLRRSGITTLIYASPETRARLIARGFPHGLLIAPFARPVTGLPPPCAHTPVIGYYGPALRLRGLDLVLDTFEMLRARRMPVRLRLVLRPDGQPPPAWLRRRLARMQQVHAIELIYERLSPAELAERLAPVDVFLLPFRVPIAESPLVVPEAALSGRPVVVLDRPGVAGWARNLGGIVAERPADLPDAVLEALRRPRPVTAAGWSDGRAATVELLPQRLAAHGALWRLRLIGLCGPDGVGKTTVARGLLNRVLRRGVAARYLWSRYRNHLSKPLLGLMRLCGLSRTIECRGVRVRVRDFRRLPGLAHLFILLQTVDQAIEIGLRMRRRSTVVADRCLYDTLVDLAAETGLESFVLDRIGPLLERLLPYPRAVLLLERDPLAVEANRPDVLADPLLAERRRLYAEVARRFRLPTIQVADTPAETVARIEQLLARIAEEDGL